jgi:hypothetical protein
LDQGFDVTGSFLRLLSSRWPKPRYTLPTMTIETIAPRSSPPPLSVDGWRSITRRPRSCGSVSTKLTGTPATNRSTGAVLRMDRRIAAQPRRGTVHDPLHAAAPGQHLGSVNVRRGAALRERFAAHGAGLSRSSRPTARGLLLRGIGRVSCLPGRGEAEGEPVTWTTSIARPPTSVLRSGGSSAPSGGNPRGGWRV